MNKMTHNKTKTVVAIGLLMFLCCAWAMAPLWVNACIPTHLSEEEIEQMRAMPSYKDLTLQEQAEYAQLYREEEIPCGAQNLPVRELEIIRPIILRVEFIGIVENTDLYHYKGYTFFFIPVFKGFGGGSGYLDITTFPLFHWGK